MVWVMLVTEASHCKNLMYLLQCTYSPNGWAFSTGQPLTFLASVPLVPLGKAQGMVSLFSFTAKFESALHTHSLLFLSSQFFLNPFIPGFHVHNSTQTDFATVSSFLHTDKSKD